MSESGGLPPRVWRVLISIALVAFILLAVSKALSRGDMLMMSAPLLGALMIFFLNRIQTWFIAAIALYFSWVYVPGLPESLSLHHVAAGALVPALVVVRMLRPVNIKTGGFMRLAVLGYLATIVVVILVRGFGLRMFGSAQWGGAVYVHLMIMTGLFLLSDGIDLSAKQWRIVLILFLCAGLIPSLAELVYILSRGEISELYIFIRPDRVSARSNMEMLSLGGGGVVRFQVSKYISLLLVLAVGLHTGSTRSRLSVTLLCLVSFLFAGLSGHRTMVLFLILFIPMQAYLVRHRFPWGMAMAYVCALSLLVLFLHYGGRMLPLSVQRSVSWVPMADISEAARYSATGTTVWRLDVWRRLLVLIPDYLLVGRGFTFFESDLFSVLRSNNANIEWAVVSHNYHSGPLSLLVDLGIPGLVFGSLILIGGSVRHLKVHAREWQSPVLRQYHRVLVAMLVVNVIIFYVLHGDAGYSVIDALMLLMLMEGMWRTDQFEAREAERDTQGDDGPGPEPVMGPFSNQIPRHG